MDPQEEKLSPTVININNLRKDLKIIGAAILAANKAYAGPEGEVHANYMLSYRHIEDTSMRLGKVLQALNEGISVYDKNVVGSPE